jgi:hypothetical protein
MSNKSIQVRLDLTAVRDGVACFGSHDQTEYCAVVEVAGSQESLAKVDEAKQEELLAAYVQFLNSLTFPFQLLVQVRPVDLTWYVTRVEERARMLSPGLVAIARDHAAFVQGLTRQRTLLETTYLRRRAVVATHRVRVRISGLAVDTAPGPECAPSNSRRAIENRNDPPTAQRSMRRYRSPAQSSRAPCDATG